MMKMKTKITLFAATFLGAMSLMTSCSKDSLESGSDSVMLEAEVSGVAQTRAAVEGTTLPAGSNYGLYVMNNGSAVASNIKMSASSTSTGYELTSSSEVQVGAYYPYDEKASLTKDYMYIYPGSTDYLHTTGSSYYTKSNPKATIRLYHALARVKFIISVASDAVGGYNVGLSGIDNVYNRASMHLLSPDITDKTQTGTLKLPNVIYGSVKAGEFVSTECFVIPQSLTKLKPSVNVVVDNDAKDVSDDLVKATASGEWESGKVYTYNITIKEGTKVSVSSCVIEEWGEAVDMGSVDVKEVEKNETGEHEYVDLGLSVKWATCNVGANAPEEYGLYFAWGETIGYGQDTNDGHVFDLKSYKWNNGTTLFDKTKYCLSSSYGLVVDNKHTLESEDDAAHVNWGGDWRMPTATEQEELLSYCTWTWTTENGVSGFKVVGRNGNSIFLPAVGYRMYNSLFYVNESYYWSSSLSGLGSNAYCFQFYSQKSQLNDTRRDYGCPIRAVHP